MGGGSLGELRLAVAQLDDVSKPPARRRAALDEAVALLRRRPEPTAEVRRLALRCAEAARRWSDDAGAAGCEAWRRWYAFAAAEIYCGLGEAEGSGPLAIARFGSSAAMRAGGDVAVRALDGLAKAWRAAGQDRSAARFEEERDGLVMDLACAEAPPRPPAAAPARNADILDAAVATRERRAAATAPAATFAGPHADATTPSVARAALGDARRGGGASAEARAAYARSMASFSASVRLRNMVDPDAGPPPAPEAWGEFCAPCAPPAAAGDACACCPAAPAARRRGGGPGGSLAAPASRDAAGAGLTLFVSMPDGRTTTLRDVAPDCQVDELKACLATIADRAGGYDSTKPCADVELVYGSRHLASGASVAQYRLPQNATLYGLVGLLGGKRAKKKKSKTKDPVRCTLRQWVDTGYLDGRAYVCSWRHAEGCKVCQDRPFAPSNRPADERKAGWQGPGFFTKRYREHSYVVAPGLPPPRPDEPGVHPALAAIKKTECDAGYQWLLESEVGHFRCAGGSHTATADEFQKLVEDFGFPDLAHFVTSKKKLWLKWHGKTVDDYLRAAYFTRERRDRAAELSPASANWELAKRTFKQRYALWKRKSENYAVDAKVCAAHDFPLN